MNYKQLTNEVKESRLLLQKAYDRGYTQAQAEYCKPSIHWVAEPREGGIQFKCDGCKLYSIASYSYCPWCGCPADNEDKRYAIKRLR